MKIQKVSNTVRKIFEIFKHTEVSTVQMTYCAYSCTQYCLHTQYMLLTHADDLLCIQLRTVLSPYTVHASNPC